MPPELLDLRGSLRVDVFDHLGGKLIAHGRLLIEPAPLEGQAMRARLEPDPQFTLEGGAHYVRLPSGEGWAVDLRSSETGRGMDVVAPSTPMSAAVGGE